MTAREVELSGGAPWGFRMHGGSDQNQPLRISRVNPGRKASLSGIREGDVISSINGRPTKGMSNSDAHGMLRSAGPVLRLGLNEDREMSPRRRSIGKGSELKRPSQLYAEVQKAIPQAPVYATIRPAPSPHKPSNPRSSIRSLSSSVSTSSTKPHEEPIRFHPTNPFYTTLPSNYTSASKLPVPNGKANSHLDRNKFKDNGINDYPSDLKSPLYFTSKSTDYETSSLPYFHNEKNMNGYEFGASKSTANDISDPFLYSSFNQFDKHSLPNERNSKNPFETKRNSDPFEKYLKPENLNGKYDDIKNMPTSLSDNNFRRSEEVMKHSTITEHKISEIEEVKTIKKVILNGSGDSKSDSRSIMEHDVKFDTPARNSDFRRFSLNSEQNQRKVNDRVSSPHKEHVISFRVPSEKHEHLKSGFTEKDGFFNTSESYESAKEYHSYSSADAPPNETPATKPPLSSPTAPAPPSSLKRKSTLSNLTVFGLSLS